MAYPEFLVVEYLVTAMIEFRAIVRCGVEFVFQCVLSRSEMAA
jgi:hypothetical protein